MPSEPVTTEMVEQLRRGATQVEMCRNRASLECLAGWEPRIMRAAADLIASTLPSGDAEAMEGYERGLEDAAKVAEKCAGGIIIFDDENAPFIDKPSALALATAIRALKKDSSR